MKLYKCDFCKGDPVSVPLFSNNPPEGWKSIRMSVSNTPQITLVACEKCAERTGINAASYTTPKDDLYNLFVDLVNESVQEAMEP